MIRRNSKLELVELLEARDLDKHSDLNIINEACGLEVVKQILLAFSDMTENLNKPSLKSIKPLVRRYIKQNSKKSDKEIALEIGVSTSYIYKLRNNYEY
jgi:hypothetical protein